MTRDGFARDVTYLFAWYGLATPTITKPAPVHLVWVTAGDILKGNNFNCLLMKKANLEKLTNDYFSSSQMAMEGLLSDYKSLCREREDVCMIIKQYIPVMQHFLVLYLTIRPVARKGCNTIGKFITWGGNSALNCTCEAMSAISVFKCNLTRNSRVR